MIRHLKIVCEETNKQYFVPSNFLPSAEWTNEDRLRMYALSKRIRKPVWTETVTGKQIYTRLY